MSFHEVPADLVLHEHWIKLISRKDWVPNSTSNYSVICSKHLVAADFKDNTKIRQLKKGAVPSVFEGYPSYMKPEPPNVRRDARVRKRALELDREEGPANKERNTTKTASIGDPQPVESTAEITEASVDVVQPSIGPACVSATATVQLCPAAASSTHASPAHFEASAKRSFASQTEKMRTSSCGFVDRRKWRAKERALWLQIERLKETVDRYREELRKLKEDNPVNVSLGVVAGAEQKNVKAAFTLDQVTNYSRKKPTWSETTVRYCIILRNLSTKAYKYV